MRSRDAGTNSLGADGRTLCTAGARLERACPECGSEADGGVRLDRHPAVLEEDLPDIYAYIAAADPAAAERV